MKRERTFKKPEILQQMLYLRRQGWPLKVLAEVYDCDHTSVRKACLRNGLPPSIPLLPRPTIHFKVVVWDFDGERINQGKDYKDYIMEAKRRKSHIFISHREV